MRREEFFKHARFKWKLIGSDRRLDDACKYRVSLPRNVLSTRDASLPINENLGRPMSRFTRRQTKVKIIILRVSFYQGRELLPPRKILAILSPAATRFLSPDLHREWRLPQTCFPRLLMEGGSNQHDPMLLFIEIPRGKAFFEPLPANESISAPLFESERG